jgi:hypothetical protein
MSATPTGPVIYIFSIRHDRSAELFSRRSQPDSRQLPIMIEGIAA